MDVEVYTVRKICGKICFSLECKSEGVTDDESGDGDEDESE